MDPSLHARSRLTLAQVFFAALAAATLLVGMLLYAAVAGSERVILRSSDTFRDTAARHVEELVGRELGTAGDVITGVERRIHLGVVDPNSPAAVEAVVFAELLDRPRLAEVTFTRATRLGFDGEGTSVLAPERWQVSVFRPHAGDEAVFTRRIRSEGGRFAAEIRARAAGAPLLGAELAPAPGGTDPAKDLTFSVLASQALRGRTVWSDLHYSELDAALPREARRVVVTVQKAIEDDQGALLGVLRVGLFTGELDSIVKLPVDESDPHDPHRVFLCDERGRLLTRLSPDDRIVLEGDDLRVVASAPPEAVTEALRSPLLARLAEGGNEASGVVVVSGRRHLVTFRTLPDTQGWNVGIVVPEEHYTRPLEQTRRGVVAVYALVSIVMVAAGVLALRAVGRGLRGLVEATGRMRRFDFAPIPPEALFREIDAVAESLERAKTVVRAMGKYVPIDLVRRLYEENRDPELGGQLRVVTLMFTDIEGFTTLSEKLPPDALAEKLGLYLDTMTEAIRATGGTIDKYIGDAVMALWNAPGEVPAHPRAACRAALACVAATRALYASDAWRGLPALTTRYGLHTDEVMVGHFGAPARLSYTALGDGVNLAARLEPLCKQYGIILMVSEAVEAEAREDFELRKLDRVAVKGKTRGIVVYELLGARGAPGLPLAEARAYEQALDAYFERRFADAIAILDPQLHDPPSKVLCDRCLRLQKSPPPDGWDGVFVATSK